MSANAAIAWLAAEAVFVSMFAIGIALAVAPVFLAIQVHPGLIALLLLSKRVFLISGAIGVFIHDGIKRTVS